MKPSIKLSELRNTRRLKAWLRAGKIVELRERERVLGRIMPVMPDSSSARPKKWPNFAARAKKIFGGRVLPAVDLVIKERGRY
jgi:hypothetical protein